MDADGCDHQVTDNLVKPVCRTVTAAWRCHGPAGRPLGDGVLKAASLSQIADASGHRAVMREREVEGDSGVRAVEAQFLADMKELGELHRGALSRRPSDRSLAKAAGVAPTTVGKWLDGEQFPQRPEGLMAVVRLLRSEAERFGLASDDVTVLLDVQRWDDQHRAVLHERAAVTGEQVRRAKAEEELAQRAYRAQMKALPDRPKPVSAWTADQLGVHAAIAGGRSRSQAFVLPKYVPRPHDDRLRMRLTALADGISTGLVVVRGESCTGKTRTAFEAVRACMPNWSLFFPKDAGSLMAALAVDAIKPRTVLWLNEAQEYLYGTDGEGCAAALRRLLEGAGPTVVLATLWPTIHHELTDTPPVRGSDAHRHARALLGQAVVCDLPDHFTDTELDALEQRAHDDPSLAVAHETSRRSGMVTQVLAAGPALVSHYEQPGGDYGPYSKALISAAMDARRLGFPGSLPIDLLVAAVPGYLSDEQRADPPEEWQARALAYARTKVKGVVAALSLVPRTTGMGAQAGLVRLADYLDHYGRSSRRMEPVPDSLWQSLYEHASTTELTPLGNAARRWGLLQLAFSFYRKAALNGEIRAMLAAAELLYVANRDDDAEMWYRKAAVASVSTTEDAEGREAPEGDNLELNIITWIKSLISPGEPFHVLHIGGPMWVAGRMLWEAGRGHDALAWYQHLAEGGSVDAPHAAVRLLRDAGQDGEIIPWIQARAESGSVTASVLLPGLLQDAGRVDEALSWCQMHPNLDFMAGRILREAGRVDEALAWYQRRADAGDQHALEEAADLLEKAGRLDDAVNWYRLADATREADSAAVDMCAHLLTVTRRAAFELKHFRPVDGCNVPEAVSHTKMEELVDEAVTWLQHAVDAGGQNADDDSFPPITESECVSRVITCLQQHAEAEGCTCVAAEALGDVLSAAGRTEEAIPWVRRAAERLGPYRLRKYIELLQQIGRAAEASSWLHAQADAGNPYALEELACQARAAGRIDDALTLYRRAAESSGFFRYTLESALQLHKAAGRIDDAVTWLWHAADETNDDDAACQLAEILAQAGRTEDALMWYQRAARLGEHEALNQAAWSVKAAGRVQDGDQMRRYGWEPNGTIAKPWNASLRPSPQDASDQPLSDE